MSEISVEKSERVKMFDQFILDLKQLISAENSDVFRMLIFVHSSHGTVKRRATVTDTGFTQPQT